MTSVYTKAQAIIESDRDAASDVMDALMATKGLEWVLRWCANEAAHLTCAASVVTGSPVRRTELPDGGVMENIG